MKLFYVLISLLILFIVLTCLNILNQSENGVLKPYTSLYGSNSSGEQSQSTLNTIIVTGDVMLGRSVQTRILKSGNIDYPFLYTADLLSSADISLINLENPIVSKCPLHDSGFIFCARPEILDGVKNAGIDIVNLANNHTLNYGRKGIDETKDHLEARGIEYTGTENLVIIESNGTRFGFLGFDKSEQTNPILSTIEENLISESNNQVDVLVVSMHWGVEYKDKANEGQMVLARKLVDLGADLIVGHHPHWVQNYEDINGVPVYYSLGNLVFDQMWSEKTKEGKIVKITFEGKNIISRQEYDAYTKDIGQPMIFTNF